MEANLDENAAKSLRRAVLVARENNDTNAISEAESKLRTLAENSDDVETHFHLAMIESTSWSKTLKTEDIPEKLLFLFQQHPNAVARLLLEDDIDEGKTAKAYLEAIHHSDAYRPYIDDDKLHSEIHSYLQKRCVDL